MRSPSPDRSAPAGSPRPSTPDDRPPAGSAEVREVSLRELNRHTSAVIGGVRDGERIVLTRYGIPVAVVLSVADALELAGGGPGRPIPSVIRAAREAA